jgi:hypothetical protein
VRSRDQLDTFVAGAVEILGNGQHHARRHVLGPQALMAVADGGIDETYGFHYASETDNSLLAIEKKKRGHDIDDLGSTGVDRQERRRFAGLRILNGEEGRGAAYVCTRSGSPCHSGEGRNPGSMF